jgi:regulatory protein
LSDVSVITALSVQKSDQERISVFLDGQFAFGLAAELASGLRVGQALSEAEVSALRDAESQERARQAAMGLIARRPRSEAEIRRYLSRKGYPEPIIALTIGRLSELELLDDRAFAQFWVEQRESFRPRSRLALQQELYQKGIAGEVAGEALEGLDELAAARHAAGRKARQLAALPEADYLTRLGTFLMRRGFNFGIASQVAREYWRAGGEPGTLTDEGDT